MSQAPSALPAPNHHGTHRVDDHYSVVLDRRAYDLGADGAGLAWVAHGLGTRRGLEAELGHGTHQHVESVYEDGHDHRRRDVPSRRAVWRGVVRVKVKGRRSASNQQFK